jgi:hypothetical protein
LVIPVTGEPCRKILCTGHSGQIEAPASSAALAWATVRQPALT